MAICETRYSPGGKFAYSLPVSGAGSNIPAGTIMMPGTSGGTNKGIAIPATAATLSRAIGILTELHKFSASGDATTATLVDFFPELGQLASSNTAFPSHPIELCAPVVIIRMDYSLVSTVAVASATSTVLTITSEEANFDTGWVYVNAGVGIGQLEFVQSSASGSITVPAAMTTTLTSTSKLTKVLPFFYEQPLLLVNTTTQPTLLDSQAAAGGSSGSRCLALQAFILRGNQEHRLNPKSHNNLQGLSSLATLALYSEIALTNTAFTPNS